MIEVRKILNAVRKDVAAKEQRNVIDVENIGRDAGKTIQKPMVSLREDSLFSRLGVKILDKLTNNVCYPIITSQCTKKLGETENPQDIVDSLSFTFDSIDLIPQRYFSYLEYDRQIVLSNDADVVGSMVDEMERSIIEAVETDILNKVYPSAPDVSSVNTISNYEDLVNLELKASNNKISNAVYLVSPLAAQKLKSMTNNVFPIWQGDRLITGKPIIETPLLTDERVILGDFSRMVLGIWDRLSNYTFNPVTKAPDGIVSIIINSYWDGGIIDPSAFIFGNMASN